VSKLYPRSVSIAAMRCIIWGNLIHSQGCQMVYFQTQNPNLDTFWRSLEWNVFLYFMVIWNILWPLGVIYGIVCGHWYVVPILVLLGREKSGNPVHSGFSLLFRLWLMFYEPAFESINEHKQHFRQSSRDSKFS
jgi:hypothetical protein